MATVGTAVHSTSSRSTWEGQLVLGRCLGLAQGTRGAETDGACGGRLETDALRAGLPFLSPSILRDASVAGLPVRAFTACTVLIKMNMNTGVCCLALGSVLMCVTSVGEHDRRRPPHFIHEQSAAHGVLQF